jgi:hypothetical protein
MNNLLPIPWFLPPSPQGGAKKPANFKAPFGGFGGEKEKKIEIYEITKQHKRNEISI